MTQAYYRKTPQQALEAQNASAEGLSAQEARRRAEQYGPNKLSEGKKKSTLQVFGLAELSRGDLGHLVKLKEAGAEIHAHGPVGAGDVLMHQGLAQFSGVDGAQNALDHHRDSSCLLLLPLL